MHLNTGVYLPIMHSKPLFFTYILTNADRTVLYVGVTNDLRIRLIGHWISTDTFVSKYKVYYLVWYETTRYVLNAIEKEKSLKALTRAKKEAIINEHNPEWRWLNADVLGVWPPDLAMIAEVKELYAKYPDREWR